MNSTALLRSLLTVLVGSSLVNMQAQTGSISGQVVDKRSAVGVPFALVQLDGQQSGDNADFNGRFQILDLEPGTYNLVARAVGYNDLEIQNVEVEADVNTKIDFLMITSSTSIGKVVVNAKAIRHTETALLKMRQRSSAVTDGMSADEMSRFGVGDVAEASAKITGLTVMNGKYIFVRGLGDRYSNPQLNGLSIPSTDPYKNSAKLDMLPTNLLDNIITSKSFTPDQPGTFTGGNVNMTTKSFPEQKQVLFSASFGFNTNSSFRDGFLTQEGGEWDWLGYDDGSRAVPAVLLNPDKSSQLTVDSYIKARTNPEIASIVDEAITSVNPQMAPSTKKSLVNQSYSFSIGDQDSLFNRQLGYIFSLSYKHSYKFYDDGLSAGFELLDKEATGLNPFFEFTDMLGAENPQVGGMAAVAYRIADGHELKVNYMYNHDTELLSRYQTGSYPGAISSSNNVFETRTIEFTENGLSSLQVSAQHALDTNKVRIDWMLGRASTFQKQPDLRFFANDYNVNTGNHFISPSEYDLPYHYFRELGDLKYDAKADVTMLITQDANRSNKVKFGGLYSVKSREFNEQRFQVQNDKGVGYHGNPMTYFDSDNLGIIGYDSVKNKNIIGLYLTDETIPGNNYTGIEKVAAGYALLDYALTSKLRFIGGARAENTNIHVESMDTSKPVGDIQQLDILPSLNLVYELDTGMNLRAAYSHTIARPNMRELAPLVSFDFIGGFIYLGNPDLERTLVRNFDVRWEWFQRAGEIIAVSAYHKHFRNPIQRAFTAAALNPEISFINVAKAQVSGLEIEYRKKLDFISEKLRNFRIGTNFSLIRSTVDVDSSTYAIIEQLRPDAPQTRPFQGQSPFIGNVTVSYENDSIGLEATLSYNVFGDRLSSISRSGTPDNYERSRGDLNLLVRKRLGRHFSMKAGVKNILDTDFVIYNTYMGTDYIFQRYARGRTITFGLSYRL